MKAKRNDVVMRTGEQETDVYGLQLFDKLGRSYNHDGRFHYCSSFSGAEFIFLFSSRKVER